MRAIPTKHLALAMVSLMPLVYVPVFVVVVLRGDALSEGETFAVHGTVMLVSLFVVLWAAFDIKTNKGLSGDERVFWLILALFALPLVVPIYVWKHRRTSSKP